MTTLPQGEEILDRKFTFNAIAHKNGHFYSEDNAIVFLAKDVLFLPLLHKYLELCILHDVGKEQLEGVRLLIQRVERWQRFHLDELKLPDVSPGSEAERVCAPNA